MTNEKKIRRQLYLRLDFNAQDVGMIRLRDKGIGNQLQIQCTALWIELGNTQEISQSLINRLSIFHNNVESVAKQVGLYQ